MTSKDKVNLTIYLKKMVDENMKEKEKNEVISLNDKIAKFVDNIFNTQPESFQLLYAYCKECQAYNKANNTKLKFDIVRYAPFIEYSNYYNLSKEEDQYLARESEQLDEYFRTIINE
jgi:hypothetical protein